jgi:DNA transposition AAA+ family ATPase
MLDGQPGTGKTQTAEIIAACAGVDVVTVTMPYQPAPHALLRLVIQGFTGDIPDGKQAHLINDAKACLRAWGGLLIVDEVQNAGKPGIQTLRHLHDDSRCNFAMLLVGWNALTIVRQNPDLDSRIKSRAVFEELHGADLSSFINKFDSRLKATPVSVIRSLNDRYAAGNIRAWRMITRTMDSFTMNHPLTQDDANALLSILTTDAA